MNLTQTIEAAQQRAQQLRPKIGGFPYLAEVLRQAGVIRFQFTVASMTALFITDAGSVLQPGPALISGVTQVPGNDEARLITAIRTDQAGESTFGEFVQSSWEAGVVWYEVDLQARTCTYYAPSGEHYVEAYPAVDLPTGAAR
ncbi:uncharacterized protein YbcV [Jatrophihabitans sp. GAS493]|uniref:DUF1398 family protein n=1 Tax=Jatrophihabitans sp. GAS493 TaxID=1907575 RepID=UPI000BB709ED|nr:DUF1398 family protein [Jatrophihabitans sp. GAS493]SOD72588.1 uncharacterized protein YbcV [Jatrophihabitans sp. GAS493]